MTPVRFCLVLHLHQPVGNFDFVFEEHADDVYGPFLDFLEERRLWPVGLHVSGPLVEWLGEHHPKLYDRMGRLAADGRVELLSAGWYEPVLAALSPDDRAAQLDWMRDELDRRFGVTPVGAWLTERVWEPELAADLAAAGLEYALVDDHLARRAGVAESDLDAPIRTEWEGRGLDLLAIDETLRYLVPFKPAEQLGADLRARHERGARIAMLGDDAEKFGGWPRTKEWLYEGGWLESFGDLMDELRDQDIVRWTTPTEARRGVRPVGPVRLPPGSYPEMDGWAPGGSWMGFTERYEESARMHARVAALSTLSRERGDPEEIRRAVGRAQCNDAYWHGVFGGLYMKHLREGVRAHATIAERLLRDGEPLGWSPLPTGAHGAPGWWAHGTSVSAWIDRRFGGTISELVWLDHGVDPVDVLTRRREVYHLEALARPDTGESGGAPVGDALDGAGHESSASIHEIEASATLDRLPPTDRDVRTLVRDRVLGADTSFEAYRDGAYEPEWEAGVAAAEDPSAIGDAEALEWDFSTLDGPRMRKRIRLARDGSLDIEWTWTPGDFGATAWFAPELSLGATVDLQIDGTPEVWRYPIVTVSKCPEGFEEIEQGESVTPRWPVGRGRASLRLAPRVGAPVNSRT